MPRLALLSCLILLAGCSTPAPKTLDDMTELARAEAARERFLQLRETEKPTPAPAFVPILLRRGPHAEDGVMRSDAQTIILVPRLP